MARTTLNLDPAVLRQLRSLGKRQHKSMGRVASELLTRALADADRAPKPEPLRWNTSDLGESRVDLEDKEALRALLDASP